MQDFTRGHVCHDMPEEADITWSRQTKPFLSVGIDNGTTEVYSQIGITHCPWCGKNLIVARNAWLEER